MIVDSAANDFADESTNDRPLRVVRHASVAAFLDTAEEYLLRDEARHNLILGLAYRLREAKQGMHGIYLVTVHNPKEVVLAALRIAPQNIVLSKSLDPEALRLVANDSFTAVGGLPGVNATGTGEGDIFVSRWIQLRPGTACRVGRNEHIYQLDHVVIPVSIEGSFRKAHSDERELLIDWLDAFQTEAFNIADRSSVEHNVELRIGRIGEIQGPYFWIVGGEQVSMALASKPTPHGICIGGVWTPEDKRRHGYASAVVATLCERVLEQGIEHCYLYADQANDTSNHIYTDMGFVYVCDAQHWIFDR